MEFLPNTVGHKMSISIQASHSSMKEKNGGWKVHRSVFGMVESPNFRVRFQYKMDRKPGHDPVESLNFHGSVYLNHHEPMTWEQENIIARGIKAFVANHLDSEAMAMMDDMMTYTRDAQAKYPIELAIQPFAPILPLKGQEE